MDIRENILEKLNKICNFATTIETFDNVTLFGIGKKIKEQRNIKLQQEIERSNQLLLDTLVSEYEDPTQKLIAKTILTNQLHHHSTEHSSDAYANNKELFMGIASKVVRHILPLTDIIGIQPMQGPTGMVYSMNYTTVDSIPQPEPFNNTNIRGLQLEMVSTALAAELRELQTGFTIETMQDLKAFNSLDIKLQLIDIMSTGISTEIIHEIMADLVKLAERNIDTRKVELETDTSSYVERDSIALLFCNINQNASSIASKTRRGPANIIITTTEGVYALQTIAIRAGMNFVVAPTNSSSTLTHEGNIVRVAGKIIYSVYSTTAPVLQSTAESNEIKLLLGYKGKGACDTGYIYAPFIPFVPSGIEVNPVTFQPLIKLMTRAGKWTKWKHVETELGTKETLGNSSDYYNILTIPVLI